MNDSQKIDGQHLVFFAENLGDLPTETHKKILNSVASNREVREVIESIRQDLYLIESQIPEYSLHSEFRADLKNLAMLWMQKQIRQKLTLRRFFLGREFLFFAGVMLTGFLFVMFLMSIRAAKADDVNLRTRYDLVNGECKDPSGTIGYNLEQFARCGDVRFVLIHEETLRKSPSTDFSGLRSYYTTFRRIDLSGREFVFAKIINTRILASSLRGANLENATFAGVAVDASNFREINARNSVFRGAQFQFTDLRDANFSLADLRGAEFRYSRLQGADFRDADLRDVILFDSRYEKAKFNDGTKLPFSRERALALGMIYVE